MQGNRSVLMAHCSPRLLEESGWKRRKAVASSIDGKDEESGKIAAITCKSKRKKG